MLRQGSVLQGVSSGTYPDNATIAGSSVLARIGNTNKHLLLAPDGGSIDSALLDRHFLRKRGPEAYYGQPEEPAPAPA